MLAERDRAQVPLAVALRFWAKLGWISFGGPAGQIALMHQELVERRRWLSEGRFTHALNYTLLLPGPEAQQLATYLGFLMHGVGGGLAAGVLFILPSFVILCGLTWVYLAYGHLALLADAFYGLKPAVVGLIAFAAWRLGRRVLRTPTLVAVALAALVSIASGRAPFIAILGAAAGLGWLLGRWRPGALAATETPSASSAETSDALIGDATPTPAHAQLNWRRLGLMLAAGVALWLALFAGLWLGVGEPVLDAMAWFFTKTGLVTFGGAYAALPYVYQAGVGHYGWLSAAQVMDGLALGESTPGPLIMIVAFVGFTGAWTQIAPSFAAGAAGALVATIFTFLPSFLFILVGAPLVEAGRGQLGLAAPLRALTAAVVGIIAELALRFAGEVCWPQGQLDGLALALAGASLGALAFTRIGIVPILFVSALAGIGWRLVAG